MAQWWIGKEQELERDVKSGLSAKQIGGKHGVGVASVQNAKKALKLTGITPKGPARESAERLFAEVDALLAPNPTRAYPDDPAMEIQKAGEELVTVRAEIKTLQDRLYTLQERESELSQLVRLALKQMER